MDKPSVPKLKKNNTSAHERGFYYYKDVKMDSTGFRFEDITEISIDDGFPLTTKMLVKDHRIAAINDFFIVVMNNNKEIANIVLRKNLDFISSGSINPIDSQIVIPPEEFEEVENKECLYSFYKFCKLAQMEIIRLRFIMQIHKIVLNGDQIIFAGPDKLIVYTLFSMCEIKATALDVAISRNMYILTENSILVYGNKLIKTIKVDRIFRFIVPTPLYILGFTHSSIFKIRDDEIVPYLELTGKVLGCCFDDSFIYCVTATPILYKISLYDPYYMNALRMELAYSRISLCGNYIVLYDSKSAVAYVDKNDFSKFNRRNLAIDLCAFATFEDTIIYVCVKNTIAICKYLSTNSSLQVVKQSTITPAPISHPKLVLVDDVIDAITEYTYGEESDSSSVAEEPSSTAKQDDSTANNSLDNKNSSDTYRFYGISSFAKRSDSFSQLCEYKIADDIITNITAPTSSEPDPIDIMCSPPLTMPQYSTLYDSIFSKEEEPVIPQNNIKKFTCEASEKQQDRIYKEVLKICDLIQNHTSVPDDYSSDSDGGLFFDKSDNLDLINISHPVLRSIPNNLEPKRKVKRRKYQMHDVFEKVMATTGISNPLVAPLPARLGQKEKADAIMLGDVPRSYTSSMFFVENHIDFFKKRFKPRDSEEKPYKGTMYSFICEELKRISSNIDGNPAKTNQKIELPKNKKGGGF